MYHLSNKTLVGLCYRTLSEKSMLNAASHLSWCASCRQRAEALGASLSPLDSWSTAPLPAGALRRALRAAQEHRAQNVWWRKTLRAAGLSAGAVLRPLRLGVTLACLLALVSVAVGATWSSLSASWTVESELMLQAPSAMLTGSKTAISVKVRAESRVSLDGIPVSLELSFAQAKQKPTALNLTSKTNADGVAVFLVSVPSLPGLTSSEVVARANINGEPRTARFIASVRRELRLHLSSDKPTYQPGQIVHLRGLSLERGSGLPTSSSAARIEVLDEKGTRLSRSEGVVSDQGVFSADFELSPEAALGNYRAVFTVDNVSETRPLKVERYSLPPFAVEVNALASSTDGKTPFDVEVKATYSFGEPVSSGTARLAVTYNGQGVSNLEAPIKNGVAKLTVKVDPWVAEQAKYNGGALSMRATVIDPAARAEEGRGAIALTRDTLLVDLHSEARSFRPDLPAPNRVLIRTTRPDGSPVSAKVQVLSPDIGQESIVGKGETVGELETDAEGIGSLELPPAFFGRQLATLVTDPKDSHQLWKTFAAPPVRSGASILRCDRALLRAGQSISCDVYHSDDRAVLVRADINSIPVAAALSKRERGVSQVVLAVPSGVAGLLRIEAETAPYEDATYALVSPAEGLQVSIAGNVPKKPGEEATIALRVTDDQGRPRVAAIGLALVDAAVFARAGGETPQEIIEAMFAAPGLVPEMMALLFPAAPLGKEGAQGSWTASQQVGARWLLSSVSAAPASLSSLSSVIEDNAALSRAKESARDFYEWSISTAAWVLAAALLLALLVYSFTFRAVMFGILLATPAFFFSGFLFDELLNFQRDLVQLIAVLTGFLVLILTVWWRFSQRPDPLLVTKDASPARVSWTLALGAVAALFVLASFATLGGSKYMPERLSKSSADAVFSQETSSLQLDRPSSPPPPPMAVTGYAAAMPEPKPMEGEFDDAIKEEDKSVAQNRPRAAGGKGDVGGMGSPTRVRKEFPETLYYNPGIVTNEAGQAEIHFTVADSITTWKLYALATDNKGNFGATEGGLEVFQDFFVDVEVPRDLTVSDELALQVAVHNYQKDPISVSLRATAAPGFTIDAKALAAPLIVAPGRVAGVSLPAKIEASGTLGITLYAETSKSSDAITREVEVVPNGRETRQVFSGLAINEVKRSLAIPATALVDGRRVELTLFASPLAMAFDGLEKSLAEPHGCFEQVSSVTYPNALIIKALKASGKESPELQARALRYLRLGYQQMLPYEVSGGGFSYFGDGAQVPHLTAYALLELTEMSSLIDVDAALLERTQTALTAFYEQANSFGGPAQAAYITLALVESDPDWNSKEDPNKPWSSNVRRNRAVIKQAVKTLTNVFSVTDSLDTYSLALAANAFLASGAEDYRDDGLRLLDTIQASAELVPGAEGRPSLRFATKGTSLYGSYGNAASVETTALVAHAFLRAGDRPDKAKEALRALLSMRDSYTGSFYSTQGTILALRALLTAAQSDAIEGKAVILVDGVEADAVSFDAKNAHLPQVVDLSTKITTTSVVTIAAGDLNSLASDVSYRLAVRYYTPWSLPAVPAIETIGAADPSLALTVKLDRTNFRLGDIGTATAHLTRDGGSLTRGMILVELGLPPGFRLTPEAMTQLQTYPVKRVEQRARGVVLYMEDPGAGADLYFTMPMVAMRGVKKVLFPKSRAYFYYQPWIEALANPIQLNVSPK